MSYKTGSVQDTVVWQPSTSFPGENVYSTLAAAITAVKGLKGTPTLVIDGSSSSSVTFDQSIDCENRISILWTNVVQVTFSSNAVIQDLVSWRTHNNYQLLVVNNNAASLYCINLTATNVLATIQNVNFRGGVNATYFIRTNGADFVHLHNVKSVPTTVTDGRSRILFNNVNQEMRVHVTGELAEIGSYFGVGSGGNLLIYYAGSADPITPAFWGAGAVSIVNMRGTGCSVMPAVPASIAGSWFLSPSNNGDSSPTGKGLTFDTTATYKAGHIPGVSSWQTSSGVYARRNDVTFAYTGDMTAEALVWFDDLTSLPIMAYTGDTEVQADNTLWQIGIGSNTLSYTHENGAGVNEFTITGNATLLTKTWHHVALSRSLNTVRLYLDGMQIIRSNPYSGPDGGTTAQLRIGGFNGRVEQVRIYGTSVSDYNIMENARRAVNRLKLLKVDTHYPVVAYPAANAASPVTGTVAATWGSGTDAILNRWSFPVSADSCLAFPTRVPADATWVRVRIAATRDTTGGNYYTVEYAGRYLEGSYGALYTQRIPDSLHGSTTPGEAQVYFSLPVDNAIGGLTAGNLCEIHIGRKGTIDTSPSNLNVHALEIEYWGPNT